MTGGGRPDASGCSDRPSVFRRLSVLWIRGSSLLGSSQGTQVCRRFAGAEDIAVPTGLLVARSGAARRGGAEYDGIRAQAADRLGGQLARMRARRATS